MKQPPTCDYEGSDYQRVFWEEGEREYEDRVEAVALRRLLPSSGDRLLEVGAGAGRNTLRYEGFRQIVLLDYSRTQLELAQSRLGRSDRFVYVVSDVYELPFSGKMFDAATMIRTLHHLVDPLRALQQIRKTLVDGSIFVLEFANKQHMKAVFRWWFRHQTWDPFEPATVELVKLNFNFHPRQVSTWLDECGFHIDQILTVSHFRVNALKRLIPVSWLVRVDAIMQWTGDWWQLTPSVFVRASVGGTISPIGELRWRCPACGVDGLVAQDTWLQCPSCELRWSSRDGIYDFKTPMD